jgi:50S ribosomal protein L31 type B
MNMLGEKTTKLIIVCDEKTSEYANYLRQLVSMKDDTSDEIVGVKDGTVEVAVWLEKDYVANMATISSKEHILFVGENKVSKKETPSMSVKFDKFGMKYGWLGKRAMMTVSDSIKDKETYDQFIEFCQAYEQKIEAMSLERVCIYEEKNETEKGVVALMKNKAATLAQLVVNPGVFGAVAGINMLKDRKKLRDQQFRALTAILYTDGLTEFLEG